MKVFIGPFNDRWTTQKFEHWWRAKRAGVEFHWDIDDYKETKLDHIVEKLTDFWQGVLNVTINQYLDRKKRKVKIKLHKYDTWSMDHTLATIILPMLIQLKATKHGSPFVDDSDIPKKLGIRSTDAPAHKDWETDDNFHKRWEWVMDELIWTFTQLNDDDNESQFHSGEHDIYFEELNDGSGNSEMKTGPNDTHVYDKAAAVKHQKRINRGLKLFGKYYQGLWD